MVRRLLVVGAVALVTVGTALLLSAAPASASCVGGVTVLSDLERADLVFVGTVTALSNEDRWATFTIEDLWKGDPLAADVEVRGGPLSPGGGIQAGSSVDRSFEPGGRYLLFAYDPAVHGYSPVWGPDGRFEDNACSATQIYTDDLAQFRPATAKKIEASSSPTPPATAVISPAADDHSDLPRDVALMVGFAGIIAVVVAARSFARSRD